MIKAPNVGIKTVALIKPLKPKIQKSPFYKNIKNIIINIIPNDTMLP